MTSCRSSYPIVDNTASDPAGKSHTLRYLHKIGAFPLDKFIWLDPDRVKSMLPEMPAYVVQNRTMAGVLTHKESGFIAEIIEREAMQQNKCVLVDGSLRNREWYAREFGRIRAEFPQYSIAILLITASKETVYRRAMRRAAITAREVPREVLDEAMDQVPRSFQALAPLADYSAVLNNDSDEDGVMFEPPATLERFQCLWNRIAAAPWDDPNDAQGGLPCDSLDADGDRHSVRSEAELYAQMLKSHGVSPLEGGRASDSGVSTPTSSSSSSSGGGAGAMPVAPSAIPSHHVPSSNSVVHSCDSNTGISAALGGATTYNHDNGNTTSVGLASVKPVR